MLFVCVAKWFQRLRWRHRRQRRAWSRAVLCRRRWRGTGQRRSCSGFQVSSQYPATMCPVDGSERIQRSLLSDDVSRTRIEFARKRNSVFTGQRTLGTTTSITTEDRVRSHTHNDAFLATTHFAETKKLYIDIWIYMSIMYMYII